MEIEDEQSRWERHGARDEGETGRGRGREGHGKVTDQTAKQQSNTLRECQDRRGILAAL